MLISELRRCSTKEKSQKSLRENDMKIAHKCDISTHIYTKLSYSYVNVDI